MTSKKLSPDPWVEEFGQLCNCMGPDRVYEIRECDDCTRRVVRDIQEEARARAERERAQDKLMLRHMAEKVARLVELSANPCVMLVEKEPVYLDEYGQKKTLEEIALEDNDNGKDGVG